MNNALMRSFLTQNGEDGLKAKRVAVPGAAKAVLVTLPASSATAVSKTLLANYERGGVQVNMTAPGSLPDTRLIAVMTLISRT
ncbi:MAG: hypothetical protein ACRDPX_04385 [Gaiellaceae bacterium]